MSMNFASLVCNIENQTTTDRWNGFRCDTIKIKVMQGLNGVYAMVSFPLFLNCYMTAFFCSVLNSGSLSLSRSLFLVFSFLFVCCLNANYSNIQFALKIGNLRNKQLSYSIFSRLFPPKKRKFPTNPTSISNGFSLSSHSHCHSKMHTFILSRAFLLLVPRCACFSSILFCFVDKQTTKKGNNI